MLFKKGDKVRIADKNGFISLILKNKCFIDNDGDAEFDGDMIAAQMWHYADTEHVVSEVCERGWVGIKTAGDWNYPSQLLSLVHDTQSETNPNLLTTRGFEYRLGLSNHLIEN